MSRLSPAKIKAIVEQYSQLTLRHDHGSPRWAILNSLVESEDVFSTRYLTEADLHKRCKVLTANKEALRKARVQWAEQYAEGIEELTKFVAALPAAEDVANVSCVALRLPYNHNVSNSSRFVTLFNRIARIDEELEK